MLKLSLIAFAFGASALLGGTASAASSCPPELTRAVASLGAGSESLAMLPNDPHIEWCLELGRACAKGDQESCWQWRAECGPPLPNGGLQIAPSSLALALAGPNPASPALCDKLLRSCDQGNLNACNQHFKLCGSM